MSDHEKKPRSPEEVQNDFLEMIRNKLGSAEVITLPLGMGAEEPEDTDEAPEKGHRLADSLRFELTPARVKAHLDRFVIGQDEAKRTLAVAVCDHYNHVRRASAAAAKGETLEYVKQNVILLGPTGVGKTYLIRTIAQLVGVPFVKADITKFSETGYVGGDVDDLVRELVRMADGSVELAEYGIIFLDEIDKIASASNMMGRDVSGRGVQTGLLKLLEETEVPTRSPNDVGGQLQDFMQLRKKKAAKRTINTRHILFVVSGAFTGLSEIIEKRLSERNIGFAASTANARAGSVEDVLAQVNTRDFVEYGFEPEFIGRLPIRVALSDLTEEDLFRILHSSEGSILKQHRDNFLGYGIETHFEDDAMRAVASRAILEKTGARGLMTVLESSLRTFKFHLPESPVRQLVIDRTVIEDPARALEKVLASPADAEEAFARAQVRKYEEEFEKSRGVRLAFDEAAVAMATTVAAGLHMKVADYLETVFGGRADFLRRVQEEMGLKALPVTPQILNHPEEGVDVWLRGSEAGSARGLSK